jgi:hypothetical protein
MGAGMRFAKSLIVLMFAAVSYAAGAQGLPTVNLESRIIEDFDEKPTTRWIARGSKFTTVERDQGGKATQVYPVLASTPGYPLAAFGRSKDKPDRGTLGLHGKFDRKGYNFIEIIPAAEAPANTEDSKVVYADLAGKKWVHRPIELPGKIHYMDLWVWGSNLKYYLDVHLEDYKGEDFVIRMGDLNFFGWKNLRIGIPSYISQASGTVPRFRNLRFTKFTLWTRPEERVDDFYFYLDHFKVLTDLFESRYDGDDLEEPETLKQVWGTTWNR